MPQFSMNVLAMKREARLLKVKTQLNDSYRKQQYAWNMLRCNLNLYNLMQQFCILKQNENQIIALMQMPMKVN